MSQSKLFVCFPDVKVACRLVARVGDDRVVTTGGVGFEHHGLVPAVVRGQPLDVGGRQVGPQGGRTGDARRVEVVVNRVRLDRGRDRPHVSHGPLLAPTVDRVEQVRDRDGRDDSDNSHHNQQLDEGETALSPHEILLFQSNLLNSKFRTTCEAASERPAMTLHVMSRPGRSAARHSHSGPSPLQLCSGAHTPGQSTGAVTRSRDAWHQ